MVHNLLFAEDAVSVSYNQTGLIKHPSYADIIVMGAGFETVERS